MRLVVSRGGPTVKRLLGHPLILMSLCRALSVHCLKDLKIFVPEAVIMGNAATLSCQYDLEQVSDTSSRSRGRRSYSSDNNTDIVVGGMLNYYNYLHFVLPSSPCFPSLIVVPVASSGAHYLLHLGFSLTHPCYSLPPQAALYAVRWYFGQEEFYRYVPREAKPTFVFSVAGINVDVS